MRDDLLDLQIGGGGRGFAGDRWPARLSSRSIISSGSNFVSLQACAQQRYYRESRSVMIAETNPNHTAMMTGAYGDALGHPRQRVRALRAARERGLLRAHRPAGRDQGCPPRPAARTPTARRPRWSSRPSSARATRTALLTAAIFGKPKLGRIFAARRADGARRDVDHLWAPCAVGPRRDEYCGERARRNPVTGYAIDDAIVMDEVLRSVDARASAAAQAPARLHLREPPPGRPRGPRHRHAAGRLRHARSARPTTRSSAWSTSSRRAASGAAPC